MNKQGSNSRRNFLKAAALAGSAALGVGEVLQLAKAADAAAQGPVPSQNSVVPSRNYLGKNTRLSISMWDFSWSMTQYPAALMKIWNNGSLRPRNAAITHCGSIAFPRDFWRRSRYFPAINWVPGKNLPKWGEIAKSHTCNVRKEVARLAELCRKYGIWLGLDSWDVAHMFRAVQLPFIETSGAQSILLGLPNRTRIPHQPPQDISC